MTEIAAIHARVEASVLGLSGRVRRIHDTLDHLRHETLLRFELVRTTPEAISRWLAEDAFALDAGGWYRSTRPLEAPRGGAPRPDAVTVCWPAVERDNPAARARLFALRELGGRLAELARAQPELAWISYQDVTNVAVVYPAIELATILPASFDGCRAPTFVSVEPGVNPAREVRWTPPRVDRGGGHLITSASIPVYQHDRLVGVWSVDVPLHAIRGACAGPHGAERTLIVDLDGWILDPELLGDPAGRERGSVVRRHLTELGRELGALDLRAMAREGAGTIERYDDDTGEVLVVVYRVVPDLGWVFLGTLPKSAMLAAIDARVHEAFDREDMQQLVDGCDEMSAALQADLARRELDAAELTAAKTAAEAANAAKDQFIASLSHELRTPLSPILAAVSLLQEDPRYAGELEGPLELIRRNVALEAHLIDDLLDINAITLGRVRLDKRSVDASEIITRACETCLPELDARGIACEVVLEATEHHLEADPARVQQAVWNLVRNAAKFSEAGKSIRVRAFNPRPGRLRIEVTDQGVGLGEGDQTRIFEAFEQVGAGARGGLGIGLTIAKAVIEAHGGTIDVRSELGHGATFGLELATEPRPAHVTAERRAAPPRPRPLRVLLVEDNPDMSEVLVLALETRGHAVTAVASGEEGLRRAESETFDLVISDLGLPDMSGYDLLRKIHDHSSDPPAIAVSGYGRPEDIQRSAEAGFRRHLTKPIEIRQLDAAINEVAGASR